MRYCRSPLGLVGLSVCALVLIAAIVSTSHAGSVALEMRRIAGARVYLITADLNDPTIAVDIAIPEKGLFHCESFLCLVRRHAPVAAVTGTYFDTRTLLPVGSIISGGRKVHDSAIGTAVCFVRTDGPTRVSAAGSAAAVPASPYAVRFLDKRKGEPCDWTGVETGLRTGPRLLAGGLYALNPRREGFRNAGLFGKRVRMALGVTEHNKLLLAAIRTPVTFGQTAAIMKRLGARDAVCLDGGSSSAMYYRGRVVCWPGRALTNVIHIKQRQAVPPTVASVPRTADLLTASDTHEARFAAALNQPSLPTNLLGVLDEHHPMLAGAVGVVQPAARPEARWRRLGSARPRPPYRSTHLVHAGRDFQLAC